MSEPSSSGDTSNKGITDEQYEAAFKNAIAVEGISEKLAEVTSLAEELDQALRSAQQDSAGHSTIIPIVVTPSISGTGSRGGDVASTSTEVGNAVFCRVISTVTAFVKDSCYVFTKGIKHIK